MLKFFVDKIDTVDPYKLTKVICKQVSSSQKIKLKLRDLTALWGITKVWEKGWTESFGIETNILNPICGRVKIIHEVIGGGV